MMAEAARKWAKIHGQTPLAFLDQTEAIVYNTTTKYMENESDLNS
jgi:hypothetical protein